MKYIRTFNNYKKYSKTNEEFLGGLFKKLKTNASVKFSKMFGGSAKQIDNLIDDYKKSLEDLNKNKIKTITDIGNMTKNPNLSEQDKEKLKVYAENFKKANLLIRQKKENLKKQFDLKVDEVIKKEKNENLKHYVKLKRIELEGQLIDMEMEELSKFDIDENTDGPAAEMLRQIVLDSKKKSEKISAALQTQTKTTEEAAKKAQSQTQEETQDSNEEAQGDDTDEKEEMDLGLNTEDDNKEGEDDLDLGEEEESEEEDKEMEIENEDGKMVKVEIGDTIEYMTKSEETVKTEVTKIEQNKIYITNKKGKIVAPFNQDSIKAVDK